MNKYLFSALISLAAVNTSVAKTQCVSIDIPEFILTVDSNCDVSTAELIQSELTDQVFLYNLGVPASCFTIIDPATGLESIEGTISDSATGEEVDITFSGMVGLTLNAYPEPSSPMSYTAASLVTIKIDGAVLGQLATRDAGTIFDPSDPSIATVHGRLSVGQGTLGLKKVSGYIDEKGHEFNPFDPARAMGVLCGNNFADSLFGDDLVLSSPRKNAKLKTRE